MENGFVKAGDRRDMSLESVAVELVTVDSG